MEILKNLNAWFWNDYVWLPPNVTWEDISDTSTVNYAQFSDLQYGFKVAIVLLIMKYIFEKYIFSAIGCYFGLKPKHASTFNNSIPENIILEKAYCENKKLGHKQVQGLAKQLDWSERKVERWIRKRLSQDKPSTLKKFAETAWRFTFYSSIFCYGLNTLWDKPWLWECSYWFIEYPHHSVTDDIWWYYMFQLGLYWSLAISQFMDTKRKDFKMMFAHHVVAIALLSFTWICNFFRGGSLCLLILDLADIPLEAAKLAKYIGWQRAANLLFVFFTAVWIITRLVVYPYVIMYNALYKVPLIVPFFPMWYLFNTLLCALHVLHFLWTWMIFKIALNALLPKSSGVKDVRSDTDECSSSSTSENADNPEDAFNQNNTKSERPCCL